MNHFRPSDDVCKWYYEAQDHVICYPHTRRRRCSSCLSLLNKGDTVLQFDRFRLPKNDFESQIYKDENKHIPLAPWYMCGQCANLFLKMDKALPIEYSIKIDTLMPNAYEYFVVEFGYSP